MGSAILDDHVKLIQGGIPAIDIVEFHPDGDTGFNPHWHTTSDTLGQISRTTLQGVGEVVLDFLRQYH